MNFNNETIAAVATALNDSGIGIIRVSGDDAIEIVNKIYRNPGKKNLVDFESHTINYGFYWLFGICNPVWRETETCGAGFFGGDVFLGYLSCIRKWGVWHFYFLLCGGDVYRYLFGNISESVESTSDLIFSPIIYSVNPRKHIVLYDEQCSCKRLGTSAVLWE